MKKFAIKLATKAFIQDRIKETNLKGKYQNIPVYQKTPKLIDNSKIERNIKAGISMSSKHSLEIILVVTDKVGEDHRYCRAVYAKFSYAHSNT